MELRKDYLLDRWVIISEGRGKRPKEFVKEDLPEKDDTCYFCSGNEKLTPPEIDRFEKDGKWKIRVFPNKFPATSQEGISEIKTDNSFFTFSNPYGKHEVVAEMPEHNRQIFDLNKNELLELFKIYSLRFTELSKDATSKYVLIFKNHGKEAGTSLKHSHTQIISMNFMPSLIKSEIQASIDWKAKNGICPYCQILNIEKGSFRKCFENLNFVAFTPYASRYNYEIWLFSKKHCKSIDEFNIDELKDLTHIFKLIMDKLKELNCSFNFYLHNSPKGEDLHFHMEFTPRIATWAGFEIGSDAIINSISPEEAAKFYRGEK